MSVSSRFRFLDSILLFEPKKNSEIFVRNFKILILESFVENSNLLHREEIEKFYKNPFFYLEKNDQKNEGKVEQKINSYALIFFQSLPYLESLGISIKFYHYWILLKEIKSLKNPSQLNFYRQFKIS